MNTKKTEKLSVFLAVLFIVAIAFSGACSKGGGGSKGTEGEGKIEEIVIQTPPAQEPGATAPIPQAPTVPPIETSPPAPPATPAPPPPGDEGIGDGGEGGKGRGDGEERSCEGNEPPKLKVSVDDRVVESGVELPLVAGSAGLTLLIEAPDPEGINVFVQAKGIEGLPFDLTPSDPPYAGILNIHVPEEKDPGWFENRGWIELRVGDGCNTVVFNINLLYDPSGVVDAACVGHSDPEMAITTIEGVPLEREATLTFSPERMEYVLKIGATDADSDAVSFEVNDVAGVEETIEVIAVNGWKLVLSVSGDPGWGENLMVLNLRVSDSCGSLGEKIFLAYSSDAGAAGEGGAGAAGGGIGVGGAGGGARPIVVNHPPEISIFDVPDAPGSIDIDSLGGELKIGITDLDGDDIREAGYIFVASGVTGRMSVGADGIWIFNFPAGIGVGSYEVKFHATDEGDPSVTGYLTRWIKKTS